MNKNILKLFYYFSLIILIIIYIYPGSIIGKILYGDFAIQPNIFDHSVGTSLNHFFAFLYITLLGGIIQYKAKRLNKFILFIIIFSIILEFFHFFIPNRSFQILDLVSNIFGIIIGYLSLNLILILKK